MGSIYVASDAIQSMADIQFFKDVATVLHAIWIILKLIYRIISFMVGMAFGAAIPLTILILALALYTGAR